MIDELSAIDINGCPQWLLYRGKSANHPVVLFVHGGPAYPQMWYSRGLDAPFLSDFVVVHWDQRGAGKSYSPDTPLESITLDQIVDDGLRVTAHLQEKFNTQQIILVGHSWGTMVAANMASRSPTRFRAFVSVGTCANWRRGEELRYTELVRLAEKAGDTVAQEQLAELGPPPHRTAHSIGQFGQLIQRLQGFSGTSRKLSEEELAAAIGKTQEYSEAEIEGALVALDRNLDLLGEFCNRYVLQDAVPRLDLTVYFVQGEHDANTPTILAREYFDLLTAPQGKHWVEFAGCAHLAMYEDRAQFLDVLKAAAHEKFRQ